jgi:4a-hydroxytetrahydrobiopterin dehydratase
LDLGLLKHKLNNKKCLVVNSNLKFGESMKLTSDQINEKMESVPGWELSGNEISKLYHFEDFGKAMKFVNGVAHESENMDHHPDIVINYNRVNLILSTHSEGGLTEKDFNLAQKINQLED